ncbi:hypothetical protein TNCT_680511 [Trichonephila clavata]|uniref:LIM zinc-binding domain-containing protein n=1 Tax=Trichonephila clavata TaxID=2740835 RepID=A0A8X6LNB0_TRICU|nr:hypothetical protein TNCT_680511 [Trichonephila clavata]
MHCQDKFHLLAHPLQKTEQEICYACGQLIRDRYLLHVNGRSWHACCLRCSVCQAALDKQPSCFIKDDNVYCRTDYMFDSTNEEFLKKKKGFTRKQDSAKREYITFI